MKAWQGLATFRHGSELGTWLYRIALHQAIDALRASLTSKNQLVRALGLLDNSQRDDAQQSSTRKSMTALDQSTSAREGLYPVEKALFVEELLSKLTIRQRQVIKQRL